MEVLHNENLQENGTTRELGLRGRRGYLHISIWRPLAMACKEGNEEEEGGFYQLGLKKKLQE